MSGRRHHLSLLKAFVAAHVVLAARAEEEVEPGSCPADDPGCRGEGASLAAVGTNHHWPKAWGPNLWSPVDVGVNITGPPSWVWRNELDEMVRHAPLIDSDKNIYIVTSLRIRKFAPGGQLLWSWTASRSDGVMPGSPVLYGDSLYAVVSPHKSPEGQMLDTSSLRAHLIVFALATGDIRWKYEIPYYVWTSEISSPYIESDILLYSARDRFKTREIDPGHDGSNMVVAVDLNKREELWTYKPDDMIWHFKPVSLGDGTIIIATPCAAIFHLKLATGELVRRFGWPGMSLTSTCGRSGGVLGEDGNLYVGFNFYWSTQGKGYIGKYRISDGIQVWNRSLGPKEPNPYFNKYTEYGVWQIPTVGRLSPGGRLAVVGSIGGGPSGAPYPADWNLPQWAKDLLWKFYLESPWFRRMLGVPVAVNRVIALDAESGGIFWQYDLPSWDRLGGIDDEEKLLERAPRHFEDWYNQPDLMCAPSNLAKPVIDADGTVYVADGRQGVLYAIKDKNEDGFIIEEDGEVQRFVTGVGFYGSPSIAPGLLVAAPCFGDAYVFQA
mmetsp:Transcript_68527/g.164570  ORF Transcript_68527/g.164570 Transcript_68527/m.164570 type:complete len:552 (-) Transcript_68527:101-1756(-)